MHASLLTHGSYRYFWIALVLALASLVAYLWHTPEGAPPNGGTWLGYTLGTIGALLIFWLTWFGVRKRRYGSGSGTAVGWLSAHVYLGTSLILIAFLHSGFQVGWNVHTLALVLMLGVIFSGFFGVYAYLRYPTMMTRNRENATRNAMLDEIVELDQNALTLADAVDPKIHSVVLRSIERTRLGGGVWMQLTARDDSEAALSSLRAAATARDKELKKKNRAESKTMFAMVDFLSSETSTDKQAEALRKLIDLLTRKKALAGRVAKDIQLQALMEIWLYVHVPLSIGLLAALVAHIVSVFFYW
ncbi:hypothetical protein [Pseudomarimonas salicorniae]|uniref:Ferric reductase like transmembrane component n=1 Tax=Pseudomarimonas salicorniae TaxID=2933270 RepID=A0ABT0GFK7_9GAMM|nr:hypothetical protein [Lysobacter sp. CAU 1642]MCK7593147.1 hypothetical protein [Lysobacter sp. CAU 1642]